jgi:hypothetical protein
MTSEKGLQLLVDWEPAEGITAPELAATWCRLEVRVAGRVVSAVEDERTSSMRRAIFTSAYPLAEWIAENWWLLRAHVRPSTVPRGSWAWAFAKHQPWLRSHNIRAAGGGLPWPDLTIVSEGALTRLVWNASPGLAGQPVTFLSSGDAFLPSDDVTDVLARFVSDVIDRLDQLNVSGTVLQREWRLLADCDDDENDFAAAVARLGQDPFAADEALEDDILALAEELEPEVLAEFLDSARPTELRRAMHWLVAARGVGDRRPRPPLATAAVRPEAHGSQVGRAPWIKGYVAARAYREQLGLGVTDVVRLEDLVGTYSLDAPAGGLQGVVVVDDNADVGLVLPTEISAGPTSIRFAQARALGLSLLTDRQLLLLDPAHTDLSKKARAFAAELLAPAEGIRTYFDTLPEVTHSAFEAVGSMFEASPLLVQHQYDNQVVRSSL